MFHLRSIPCHVLKLKTKKKTLLFAASTLFKHQEQGLRDSQIEVRFTIDC